MTIVGSRKALRENNGKRLRLGNPPPVIPARRPPAGLPPTAAEYGAPEVAKKTGATVKPLKIGRQSALAAFRWRGPTAGASLGEAALLAPPDSAVHVMF